jgi:glycosyltransferase involved in cell wall biosynthesis
LGKSGADPFAGELFGKGQLLDATLTQDYWTYYGADRRVELTTVGNIDFIGSPLPGPLKLWAMNRMLRRAYPALLQAGRFGLLYTRAPALLPALLATGIPTVLELHQLPRRNRRTFVRRAKKCALVVALTSPMRETLVRWGVPAETVIVEGDAVDVARFARLPTVSEARTSFSLSTPRPVVGYVGRLKTLGMDKGVADLLRATALLRTDTRPILTLIVGGPESDRRDYERMADALQLTADDVRFVGEIEAARVPAALACCDLLAMPFPDYPHYRTHMSPLKMFEYMAAGRPILTSDLPTVRDVLSEETAFFCAPGDPASLAAAIRSALSNPDDAASRAARAATLVRERHTWAQRMGRIIGALPAARP